MSSPTAKSDWSVLSLPLHTHIQHFIQTLGLELVQYLHTQLGFQDLCPSTMRPIIRVFRSRFQWTQCLYMAMGCEPCIVLLATSIQKRQIMYHSLLQLIAVSGQVQKIKPMDSLSLCFKGNRLDMSSFCCNTHLIMLI